MPPFSFLLLLFVVQKRVCMKIIDTPKRRFLYNISEYVDGQSLRQWIDDHPQTHINTVREYLLDNPEVIMEAVDLLEQGIDFLIELRSEWEDKRKSNRDKDKRDYADLSQVIGDVQNFLRRQEIE